MAISPRRTEHETMLAGLAHRLLIMPYDQLTAEWHASQRAKLSQTGKTPPFEDGQIAAVAAVNQLVLVTDNTSDFQHFEGLELTNWAKPQ